MLNRFLNDPHNGNSASLIIYSVSRVSGSSQSFQRKIISKGHLCYAIYDKHCKIMCSLFSRFANLHSLWAVPIHVQRPDMLTLTKYRTMNNNHCCVVMWKPINLHMLMRSMPPLEHTTIYISCTSVSYGLQCTTKCNLKLAFSFPPVSTYILFTDQFIISLVILHLILLTRSCINEYVMKLSIKPPPHNPRVI